MSQKILEALLNRRRYEWFNLNRLLQPIFAERFLYHKTSFGMLPLRVANLFFKGEFHHPILEPPFLKLVHLWFGARVFGFLGSPKMKVIVTRGTNLPLLLKRDFKKKTKKLFFHLSIPENLCPFPTFPHKQQQQNPTRIHPGTGSLRILRDDSQRWTFPKSSHHWGRLISTTLEIEHGYQGSGKGICSFQTWHFPGIKS